MKNLFIFFILMTALAVGIHAQGLTIGSGTTFSLGSSTLYLPNNWSNSGTFNAENGTVVLNGSSGNQTIANSSGEIFNILTVDKSTGDIQLLDSVLITGNLTLMNGDLDLNDNLLRMGGDAIFNETPGNTVKGGTAVCTKTLTAPTSVNMLGAEITSSEDLGVTTIERGHTEQNVNGLPSILRYYDITPTNNTGLNATMKIYYDESELNGLDEAKLDIYWYNPVSSLWERQGATCDKVNNYCTVLVQHFSRWTIAEAPLADSDTLYLSAGWNLVSVPRTVSNDSAHVLFSGKMGSMYGYNTATGAYDVAPTLTVGLGYWVYYAGADTVVIEGSSPGSPTATAEQAGWVMIGSRETPVAVSSLILSDGAVINGSAYKYDPGLGTYVPITVIDPGIGAWINVSKACTITIP